MYKRISLILTLSLAASTSLAGTERANYGEVSSPEETIGFFSGMAIGGAAGGPPGFVIGAAIGALMGDGWNAKRRVGDLQADLYASRLETDVIREETIALQREYRLAQQELNKLRSETPQVLPAFFTTQVVEACCDNTVLSLHFRSGSSVIESHYEEQLTSLVKLARKMPTASVEITGYADRNGDADRNLALSRARTDSVKQFFNRSGFQNSSINTVAYGETRPLQPAQSFEADFFDRRVIVRLRDTSKQMLSRTPDGE